MKAAALGGTKMTTGGDKQCVCVLSDAVRVIGWLRYRHKTCFIVSLSIWCY